MKERTAVKRTFGQVLRENLHLTLAMALAIIAVGVGVLNAFSDGAQAAVATKVSRLNPSTVMNEAQMREVLFAPPAPTPPTVHEEKLKAVDEYRTRYHNNPEDPDAEALLRAMGNLYKQTGDFKNGLFVRTCG